MMSLFLVFAFCLYGSLQIGPPDDFSYHVNLVMFIVISLEPFNYKIFGFSDILRLDCFIYTETLLFLCSIVLFNFAFCYILSCRIILQASAFFFFFYKQFSIDIVKKSTLIEDMSIEE